jgi:site-specific recombinase XerD
MESQDQSRPKLLSYSTRSGRVMRLHHYSIHTERSYIDWIRRYVRFHKMSSRADLAEGERKIEAFLTHLAMDAKVSPSTQNQAMNALVFLYKRVLDVPLEERINAVWAERRVTVPLVLTREEVLRLRAAQTYHRARLCSSTPGTVRRAPKLMLHSPVRPRAPRKTN